MRALLDTNAFLWWIGDNPRLSRAAREFLEDGEHEIYLSAVSAAEIAVKVRAGKLTAPGDLFAWINRHMAANGFLELPLFVHHALGIAALRLVHGDPFDRLLIAQAVHEDLVVVTSDATFDRYPVTVVW